MQRQAHLKLEKEMREREHKEKMHITKKTTWRDRMKAMKQRQRRIYRVKA